MPLYFLRHDNNKITDMCNLPNINPWVYLCDAVRIEIFSSRYCVQTFDAILRIPVQIYIINGRSLDYSLLAINSRGLRSAALRSTSWEIKLCAGRLLPPAAATAASRARPTHPSFTYENTFSCCFPDFSRHKSFLCFLQCQLIVINTRGIVSVSSTSSL